MTALPIGTLLRAFKHRLQVVKFRTGFYFPPSRGREVHDIYGHILGGALPTSKGEFLANPFAQALLQSTPATKSAIRECLSGVPSLSEEDQAAYVQMILYYKEIYNQDGTVSLAEKVISSISSRGG